jgi:hypothetical protein
VSAQRQVIAPGRSGGWDACIDATSGLVWAAFHWSLDAVRAEWPGARALDRLWDAPIIDPADRATYPDDLRSPEWP